MVFLGIDGSRLRTVRSAATSLLFEDVSSFSTSSKGDFRWGRVRIGGGEAATRRFGARRAREGRLEVGVGSGSGAGVTEREADVGAGLGGFGAAV
jgi:hypothetical protein